MSSAGANGAPCTGKRPSGERRGRPAQARPGRDRPAADGAAGSWARPTRARTAPFTRAAAAAVSGARVYIRVDATPHDTDVVGPPRKNAKWRKDSHVRHFLNPDDYCGSVRADGVYTHYRRRHDPLLHGTNSRALRVDRLDRTINSYTCPARGGLEAPACTRDSRANS